MGWLVIARALVGIVVLPAALAGAAEPPSSVVYPPRAIPLAFSHRVHLRKNVRCDFCHERAPASHSAGDDLLPTEEVCTTCHEIDRPKPEVPDGGAGGGMACASCHPGHTPGAAVALATGPTPILKFDHAAHTARGIVCQRCHGTLTGVDLAGPAELPKMALCLTCHDSGRGKLKASSRCSTCHPVSEEGTLRTRFPSGTLTPASHTLAFRTQHAQAAKDERSCLQCHRQDECQTCHHGVVKPLDFHGNDYVSRHAVDARRGDPDCGACHRAQSFCLGCHERLKVTDVRSGGSAIFAPLGTRTFHPAGFADAQAAGNPQHHAWQAQRNLRQCASCHRQETCLECHASASGAGRAGRMQVSPHPLGFGQGTRCQALAERNPRVCLRCHGPEDPHLRCR
jgi:hypothetical protein